MDYKIKRLLSKLHKNSVLSNSTYRNLSPSGSKPDILYGLPKVHKANVPLRPILSAIKIVSYSNARFLVPIIRAVEYSAYCVKDSFTFAAELKSYGHLKDCYMGSLDVTSLFTQIPLTETVEICANSLFPTANCINSGLNKAQFCELLHAATTNCHFLFDGKIYDQIDGVSMGSPLGPSLPNAFMSHYEVQWLQKCPVEFLVSLVSFLVSFLFLFTIGGMSMILLFCLRILGKYHSLFHT